jgi:CDP-6-deoxy-D-xylo-4-hexulose-3-dehydrase
MKDTITWGDKWEMIKFILTTKQFTNGPKVRKFENEWSKWLGCKYSLYVTSGSTANLLLMASVKERYGLKDGDKVLVPACTWVTNVAPVIQCGLQPIFCDVNSSNYSFDPDHLLAISRKHNIKVVFTTHLLGYSADLDFYKKTFPEAIFLDDVCESHGCLDSDGTKVGANSTGATFSFYFGHHMTTIEGGFVCTNDYKLYSLMKSKRSHGLARELPPEDFEKVKKEHPDLNPHFLFITEGYNVRNHEICGVLGSSQLRRLDNMIAIRKRNYKMFYDIILKYSEHFYVPSGSDSNSSYAFPLVAKDVNLANKIKANLQAAGIETRPIVSGNLLRQPFLKGYILEGGLDKPSYIETLHKNGVYVGNNHFVSKKELQLLDKVIGDSI